MESDRDSRTRAAEPGLPPAARRVLILVENLSVPSDPRVWAQARSLRESGCRVSVICPRGRERDRAGREVLEGVSIYRYRSFEAAGGLGAYLLEYALALLGMLALSLVVLRRQGFDVVQICNPPDLLFLVAIPYKLLGKTVIFDHHDPAPELYLTRGGGRRGLVWRLLRLCERLTFATADLVMSTNESLRRLAVERGRCDPAEVVVVRNAPDLGLFEPARGDAGRAPGAPHRLCWVGAMGPQDGLDRLLRAIRRLREERRRDDFRLELVGDGVERPRLERLAAELGLEGLVTFTGWVPHAEIPRRLARADVCLCPDPKTPSNDISTTIKALEYMAMGKPIVAFDLAETRESAGGAALYAAADDEREFAERIAELLDSPQLRARLGALGAARIRDGMSWRHSEEALRLTYERAFRRAARSGA